MSYAVDGASRIVAERMRQLRSRTQGGEGRSETDDDQHVDDELAWAATCYAAPDRIFSEIRYAKGPMFCDPWPWDPKWDKRPQPALGNYPEPEKATIEERIALLVKAGALCAAEIDRLERLRAKAVTSAAPEVKLGPNERRLELE